jgi:hypothetical protein
LPHVSRFLLVTTVATVAIAFCPCPDALAMAMDDCCARVELSVSASCCPPATDPVTSAPAVSTILFAAPPLGPASTLTEAFTRTSARASRSQKHSTVARTILRI